MPEVDSVTDFQCDEARGGVLRDSDMRVCRDVELKFTVRDLAYWESFSHRFCTDAGKYELLVGSSSADIRAKAEMTLEKGTTFLD